MEQPKRPEKLEKPEAPRKNEKVATATIPDKKVEKKTKQNDVKIKTDTNQKKKKTEDDTCGCAKDLPYEPICGGNGVTYKNECLFECAMKKNWDVEYMYHGECDF